MHVFILFRKTRIFASVKDKGQRTRVEDGKQKNKGQKQWNRATGTLGQFVGVREQRKRDGRRDNYVRYGTKDGRQGTEIRTEIERQGTET
jgi:hypothetical protein